MGHPTPCPQCDHANQTLKLGPLHESCLHTPILNVIRMSKRSGSKAVRTDTSADNGGSRQMPFHAPAHSSITES